MRRAGIGRRPATLADVEAIVAMGAQFIATSAYATIITPDLDAMRTFAIGLIRGQLGEGSTLIVAERARGDLVGMIGLLLYTHYFSGQRQAIEMVWWVDPAVRGGVGLRLLKDAERWARSHGAISLEMIAPTPRIELLYELLGFRPVERTFSRRL